MLIKKMKKILTVLLMLFISSSVFAIEEYVSEIYKQIDTCFTAKDEKQLNKLLSANTTDKYYYLMENYTQKKIRRLIVNNEYDFAMEATLVVIENNLDNEEAVELYSLISDAYEIQQKHEAELERQRELEEARLQLEKEKQRGTVEKEYVAATKTSSGSVYVSGKETKLTSTNWKVAFGLADMAHLLDTASSISTFHYGVSADFRYEYTMENKTVMGADAFAGVQFLGIAKEDKLVPLLGDFDLAFKAAFPQISKNLFIRAGFDAIIAGKSNKASATEGVVGGLYSPYLGVKLERIPLGIMKLDFGAEWLAGHLFNKDVKVAAGGSLNVEFPFAELEKVKLNLNLGIRDRFFMKNSGMENRASIILAIGVENVVR